MPEVLCEHYTSLSSGLLTWFDLHTAGSVLQHWTLNKVIETALLSLLLLPGIHLWLGLTASVRLLLQSQRFSSCLTVSRSQPWEVKHPWVPEEKSGSSNSTAPSWPRNLQTQLSSTSHQASSLLGWFQKPESASQVSPGQLWCLQQILSKKIRRKEKKKKKKSLMWFLPGEYILLWAEMEQSHFSWDDPQCHNHLLKQCQNLELARRIQPIFEASHLLLHA